MKPKNFPGRKNFRRVEAIERGFNTKAGRKALENAQKKLLPQVEAEAIRSKKKR